MSYETVPALMTGICDAIRSKDGTTDLIPHQDIPARIDAIPTGGGGGVVEKDVNFYDYEGTLVASYTVAEAQALTALPDPPDHSQDEVPLTFQGWNYTLEQVQATTHVLDIGAMWIPTDGKTHIEIRIGPERPKNIRLTLWKVSSYNMTIEWGDGTTSKYGASGKFTSSHTYPGEGTYFISLEYAFEYTLGNNTDTALIDSPANAIETLCRVWIGSNVLTIGEKAFYSASFLESLSLPYGLETLDAYGIAGNHGIKNISVPLGVTTIDSSGIREESALRTIQLPETISSLGAFFLYICHSIRRIVIPRSVLSVGDSSFRKMCACKEIHFLPPDPPALGGVDALSARRLDCKIYVPAESVDAYKTATNWSVYADYIYGE